MAAPVQLSFNNLSQEIQRKIIDKADLELNFRLLSKSWDTSILTSFLTMNINNRNWLDILGSSTPIKVKFLDLTYPVAQTLEGQTFATRLTSLCLSGYLVHYNLISLFENCRALQQLEFIKITHCPELYRNEINRNDPTRLLPALRKLIITFPDFVSPSPESDKFMKMFRTMDPFWGCGVSKSKLTSVEIRSEYAAKFPNLENQILGENWTPVNFTPYHHGVDEFVRTLTRDNQDTLAIVMHGIKSSKSTAFKLYPKLKREPNSTIEKFFFSNAEDQSGTLWKLLLTSDWLQFLNKQNQMKSFTLTGNLVPNDTSFILISGIWKNNSSTLNNLSLTVQRDRINSFDATTFSGLRVLREFEFLSRFNRSVRGDFGKNWQRISNIQFLPNTIRILKLSISMEFKEPADFCQKTFENLKNVQVFEFSAHPWIQFKAGVFRISQTVIYMDEEKIRNIITWLPKLENFNLRSRILPNPPTPNANPNVPDSSISWIRRTANINFDKIPVTEDDDGEFFERENVRDPDYFVKIRILPDFRVPKISNDFDSEN